MGTFRRGPWHTKRKMKSFTAFLLVGFVTVLWSTSVKGDINGPEDEGFDKNDCRFKADGVFCKFKNANNKYEDGLCCRSWCSPLPSDCALRHDWAVYQCEGKSDGENCDFYDMGYGRKFRMVDGTCIYLGDVLSCLNPVDLTGTTRQKTTLFPHQQKCCSILSVWWRDSINLVYVSIEIYLHSK